MSQVKDRFRSLIRSAKNSIKDYTGAERRVRAATSNEPWPASSRMMISVCNDMTDPMIYDSVLIMLLKRMQDKRQVMHVKKALQLTEFCLRHGSQRFIDDMKARRCIFRMLTSYRFLLHGQDKGVDVRIKAQHILDLLQDNTRLDQERVVADRARSQIRAISCNKVPRPATLSMPLENDIDPLRLASNAGGGHNLLSQPMRMATPTTASVTASSSLCSSDTTASSASTSRVDIRSTIPAPRRRQQRAVDRSMILSGGSGSVQSKRPSIPDGWLLDMSTAEGGAAPAASPLDPLPMLIDEKPPLPPPPTQTSSLFLDSIYKTGGGNENSGCNRPQGQEQDPFTTWDPFWEPKTAEGPVPCIAGQAPDPMRSRSQTQHLALPPSQTWDARPFL